MNGRKSRARRRAAGFSLIELMVVIIIIGIIGSFAAVKLLGTTDKARVAQAINDMNVIAQALKFYKLEKGVLPDSLDEIAEQIEGDEVPDDPWGNKYIYRKISKSKFDILCLGADGEEGGDEEFDKDLTYLGLKKKKKSKT
jgi:general secretion pathway protein G